MTNGICQAERSYAASAHRLLAATDRHDDEAAREQNNPARWYDATAGRWLNEDWDGFSAGDSNTIRYCDNARAGR
jgi:RHS repeat-associated protein